MPSPGWTARTANSKTPKRQKGWLPRAQRRRVAGRRRSSGRRLRGGVQRGSERRFVLSMGVPSFARRRGVLDFAAVLAPMRTASALRMLGGWVLIGGCCAGFAGNVLVRRDALHPLGWTCGRCAWSILQPSLDGPLPASGLRVHQRLQTSGILRTVPPGSRYRHQSLLAARCRLAAPCGRDVEATISGINARRQGARACASTRRGSAGRDGADTLVTWAW